MNPRPSQGSILIPSVKSTATGGESVASASSASIGSTISQVHLPNGKPVTMTQMMQYMRRILPCEDLRHNMTLYKRCFKTEDAIKAFQVAFPQEIVSNEAAVAFGRMLQKAKILSHVCDAEQPFRSGNYFFRLQCYQHPEILNSFRVCDKAVGGDIMDILEDCASLLFTVEQTAADVTTGIIDYRVAHKSKDFYNLEESLCLFQRTSLKELDEITRLAVCINLYNIMMRFAFMKVGVPDSRGSRASFLSEVKMDIGGNILSFDDIEHGILRANRSPKGTFGTKDPRAQLALTNVDPRIHFALHRTPMATAKVPLIYPHTLHYDLQRETKLYLALHSNLMIDTANRVIQLNETFRLYRLDFGNGNLDWLTKFLERNLEGGKKLVIQSLMQTGKPPTIEYMDLNWGTKAGNFFPFKLHTIKANDKRFL
jgi:Protein of unknown function, DUF547